MKNPPTWIKLNFCTGGNCVEVASVANEYWLRDSHDPEKILKFTKAEWQAFIGGVKDGEFDL